MKILNVITDSNIGGAGNVLLNFMKKTNRAEFEHTVIVPDGALLSPKLRDLGVTVREMDGIGEKSFKLSSVNAFRREFEKLAPDVVHTHASLSARIAARMWGKCAIVHTRHCAYPQGRLKTSFPAKQMLGLMNNTLSDVIIAISPSARDSLTETGTDPDKIITMFNGVEPMRALAAEEKGAVREELGIQRGDFVCAIIARLVPEKGHAYVLEAAELLQDLPIRFIIAGSGPLDDELHIAAAARGLDNCVFTGFVDDIARIQNIMDLQLNASDRTETSSLALIEGMSLGVPSVVTDVGGNPHLVTHGENGIVVPRKDGAALAAAVRELYDDHDKLARMGASAMVTYNMRFTAEVMADNIEQAYREADARRKKRKKD